MLALNWMLTWAWLAFWFKNICSFRRGIFKLPVQEKNIYVGQQPLVFPFISESVSHLWFAFLWKMLLLVNFMSAVTSLIAGGTSQKTPAACPSSNQTAWHLLLCQLLKIICKCSFADFWFCVCCGHCLLHYWLSCPRAIEQTLRFACFQWFWQRCSHLWWVWHLAAHKLLPPLSLSLSDMHTQTRRS